MSDPRETGSFKEVIARETISTLDGIFAVKTVFDSTDCANEAVKEIVFITILASPEEVVLSDQSSRLSSNRSITMI